MGYKRRPDKWQRRERAAMVLCAAVLAASLIALGRYALDALDTARRQREMSEVYHAAAEAPLSGTASGTSAPESPPTEAPAAETEAAAGPLPAAAETASQAPADTGSASGDTLPAVIYPDDPYGLYTADAQLSSLWAQNGDIRGWLQVDGLVDDAVVLRDNTFYLTHGVDGTPNSNGALFLDEQTRFYRNIRPYTYIIYGHNMKSGMMFGQLKKYMQQSWYAQHPFITFDTLYEKGRYVIFFVNRVNVEDESSTYYLPIYQLDSSSRSTRAALLQDMKTRSHCPNLIPVSGDDQILLLVTCNGADEERLVIAARRIRDDETEEALLELIR